MINKELGSLFSPKITAAAVGLGEAGDSLISYGKPEQICEYWNHEKLLGHKYHTQDTSSIFCHVTNYAKIQDFLGDIPLMKREHILTGL